MIYDLIHQARNVLFVLITAPVLYLLIKPITGSLFASLICIFLFLFAQFHQYPVLMELFPKMAQALRVTKMACGLLAISPLLCLLLFRFVRGFSDGLVVALFEAIPLTVLLAQILPPIYTKIKHW